VFPESPDDTPVDEPELAVFLPVGPESPESPVGPLVAVLVLVAVPAGPEFPPLPPVATAVVFPPAMTVPLCATSEPTWPSALSTGLLS
jgi:hypothetical protein